MTLGHIRSDQLAQLGRTFERVCTTRQGALVVIRGAPNSGRTTLVAEALSQFSRSRPRPQMLAGGFAWPGAKGDFVGRALPPGGFDAASATTLLGQVISVGAAAAAIAEPSGVAKVAAAVAALTGEAAQTAGLIADRGASSRTTPTPAARFRDTDELLLAIRRASDPSPTFVLCLDEVDRAVPPTQWCDLFLLRQLPPVLRSRPLLVLATIGVAEDDPELVLPATSAVAELVARGDAELIDLRPLTPADIERWLANVDTEIVEDLLSAGGGDPDWITSLMEEWRKAGVVVKDSQRCWTYTPGAADVAIQGVADTVRASLGRLMQTRYPENPAPPYDRAVLVLRTAALEGRIFTARPLADLLGEDPDDLIDWLDANLVSEHETAQEPLVEAGFVEVPDKGRTAGMRWLNRYAFKSQLVWTVMHPVYGRDQWPDRLRVRTLARRYARALALAYGPYSKEAVFDVIRLADLGGDTELARHYSAVVDAFTPLGVQAQVLRAEVEAGNAPDAIASFGSADRLIRTVRGLVGAFPAAELIRPLQLALWHIHNAKVMDEVATIRREIAVLQQLGNVASHNNWPADSARCEARVAELSLDLDFLTYIEARVAATERLVSVVEGLREQTSVEGVQRLVDHHVGIDSPLVDQVLPEQSPEELGVTAYRSELVPRVERALEDVGVLLVRLQPSLRDHATGHYHLAKATLWALEGNLEAAVRACRRSIEHLDRSPVLQCRERTIARSHLGRWLLRLGDPNAAAVPGDAIRRHFDEGGLSTAVPAMDHLAQAKFQAGEIEEAIQLLAHALVLARRVGRTESEPILWSALSALLHEASRQPESLECAAMSAASGGHDASQASESATRLGLEHLEGGRAHERATERFADDGGLDFLATITGVTPSDTDAFIATFTPAMDNGE